MSTSDGTVFSVLSAIRLFCITNISRFAVKNNVSKLIALATVVALIALFVVPVFAAETTFTGSYRVRSIMDYNWEKENRDALTTPPAGPAVRYPSHSRGLYTGYFDQRFRLNITHTRSEYLKAVVTIDIAEDTWGAGRAFRMNNDVANGVIHEAYLEFLVPKVGLFTIGTLDRGWGMGTYLGSGGTVTNYDVKWAIKIEELVVSASYTKYAERAEDVIGMLTWPGRPGLDATGGSTSINYNNDMDAYTFMVMYLSDTYSAGALFQYLVDPGGISSAVSMYGITGNDFNGEMVDPSIAALHWPVPNPVPPQTQTGIGLAGLYDWQVYALGFFWDFLFVDDMIRFKGEVDRIWGTGDINTYGKGYNATLGTIAPPFTPLPGKRIPSHLDLEGLNIYADLSFNFDVFTVGVAFLYGSGEKWWSGITQENFNFNTNSMSDFAWSNIIVCGNPDYLNSAGGDTSPLGLGNNQENVTSLKLYWSIVPFETLDIHGAFVWAKYTEPVGRDARDAGLNRIPDWNAFYGHPMNYVRGAYTYLPADVSDDLGWEIDAGLTWSIMEGLTLSSEFGVLFTGDAFDYRNIQTGEREEWGEIYRWINTLTYEF